MKRTTPAPVTILTGPRGDGKSLFCRALAEHPGVAGFFSPACESAPGQRYGFDGVLIPENTRFPLARVSEPARTHTRTSTRLPSSYRLALPPKEDAFDPEVYASGITLGPYVFSSSALARIDAGLRAVARLDSTRLVVLDEVGPLELERSEGLIDVLVSLLRGEGSSRPGALLVVTRPSLVVSLAELVRRERPDCVPETVTVRDYSRPDDARIIRSLTS